MLAYRVFPRLPRARVGKPGHPDYLHRPQGKGRLDNPHRYDVWYLAADAAGAIGETFGDLPAWRAQMLEFPALQGSRRTLGCYELPDDLSLLELDDARHLLDRGLRPTQVIERNRAATQEWALRMWEERDGLGRPRWAGVRWWSYHRPNWRILGIWGHQPHCVKVEQLRMNHPALLDAARALRKQVI
jgi:hypothetical protein